MITRSLRFAVVLLILICIATSSFAQSKKPAKGPRAIAVLESTPQGLRLVPISMVIEGKFYDASLYRANPVPFALDAGNVYIVQRAGEAIGDFTVTSPAQIAGGAWIGEGKWMSNEDRKKQEESRARESIPAKPAEEKDEPPVLRRGGKPAASTSAPATLPAPAAKEKAPEPAIPSPKSSDDSDRPVLKRGKPEVEQASKLGNEKAAPAAPAKKGYTPPKAVQSAMESM